ncbi:hypothetical protein QTP88_012403 [Uroleucon formosanum]
MMRIIQLILNKKKTITPVTNIENTIIDDRYNLTEDSIQNSDNNGPTTSQVNNELYINNIEIESTIDDRYNLIEDSKQNNDYNEPTTSQESNELNINFNDPGCWPTMTSRFRDLIVEKGPYLMDQNNYFPVNDEDDWKHLNPSVAEHENSKNHKQNVLDWKELEKRLRDCKTIDYALQNSIKNEKEKWFCILKVIVDGILFCAKNNLALRVDPKSRLNSNAVPKKYSEVLKPDVKNNHVNEVLITTPTKSRKSRSEIDDETHGMNSYQFNLTTLLVLDNMREGFPCAFMISNRINEAVLSIFYSKIKSLTGQLQPNVFMSDMAESFFNAWIVEMKRPKHRLYCIWHVDCAWRKNLVKVKSKDKQCKIYKLLRTLIHEQDPKAFGIIFEEAINQLSAL